MADVGAQSIHLDIFLKRISTYFGNLLLQIFLNPAQPISSYLVFRLFTVPAKLQHFQISGISSITVFLLVTNFRPSSCRRPTRYQYTPSTYSPPFPSKISSSHIPVTWIYSLPSTMVRRSSYCLWYIHLWMYHRQWPHPRTVEEGPYWKFCPKIEVFRRCNGNCVERSA